VRQRSGAARYPHARPREEAVTEPWYRVAWAVVIPPLRLWFRLRHDGLDRIPRSGPAIVACNHVSYLDPLTNGEAVDRAGRRPRFLAKDDLFRIPVVGAVLRGAGQIPVVRGRRDGSSLDLAAEALLAGEVVVIYPEGTVTRREDGLPMEGKTGIARLALRTGAPVVPMASWGSQAVWQKSGKGSIRFGRPILTKVGEAIAFDPEPEAGVERWREVTATVMAAITELAVELRDRYPSGWTG
jgi:1-acyl-sn-glycerol-3-phosphate acyltransferase